MDRNKRDFDAIVDVAKSLSARRAWIEIHFMPKIGTLRSVALRKESVDRNFDAMQVVIIIVRRSPQGERG